MPFSDENSGFTLKKLSDLLDHSFDGIIITDPDGNVIFATTSTGQLIAPYSFTQRNVGDMVSDGLFEKSIILDAIRRKQVVTEAVQVKPNVHVVSTCTPVFNEHDEVSYTITNVRNDSNLTQYLQALQKATDSITHYKNVLNYISSTNTQAGQFLTQSEKMKRVISYLQKISVSDSSVLITGESGTGKELLSSMVHKFSKRNQEAFIPVNCAAIPKELFESEFFGYERGAFSGASNKGKAGIFELANGGTVFLDEIAEMPLDLQSKLLRVLETGAYNRVGGTSLIKTSVRIVAATNRNLLERVNSGEFRADLYYRLNVIPIQVLPLRERKEDIPLLADHYLNIINKRNHADRLLSKRARELMMFYHWPGNVRELKNFIERYVLVDDEELLLGSLTPPDQRADFQRSEYGNQTLKEVLQQIEINYLKEILKRYQWNVSKAADHTGIHRTMLYRKIKQYQITESD